MSNLGDGCANARVRVLPAMQQQHGSKGLGIDVARESMLSFGEAARYVGTLKGTKGLSFQTLWRWATKGCRGVVLETICIGGSRCTSKEALHRFFNAVTLAREPQRVELPPSGGGPTLPFPDLGDADGVLRNAGIADEPGGGG